MTAPARIDTPPEPAKPRRRKAPNAQAIKDACEIMEKRAGGIGGIVVNADGSFAVLAPGETRELAERAESATIAEKIRLAARGRP